MYAGFWRHASSQRNIFPRQVAALVSQAVPTPITVLPTVTLAPATVLLSKIHNHSTAACARLRLRTQARMIYAGMTNKPTSPAAIRICGLWIFISAGRNVNDVLRT
jgi:hypothetical protein